MQKSGRYALTKTFYIKDYLGIVFASLLTAVLLFPKGKLEEHLPESANANSDLSMAYYQTLLKTAPPPEIYDSVIQSYLRAGKFREALSLVEEFQRTHPNDPEYLWFKYQLLKKEYFSKKDEAERIRIKEQMETILSDYLELKTDEKSLLKVFREGEGMYIPKVAYKASLGLVKTTGGIYWVKKAYYYSIAFRDYKNTQELVEILLNKEGIAWLYDAINIAILNGNNQDIILYASEFYKELSPDQRLNLIKKLIAVGMTDKNYLVFRTKILERIPLSREDKSYLEKEAMKRALWMKDYETLKSLILENLYLDKSLEYRAFLLELALATGDAKFAKYVAEKIHFGSGS